MVGKVTPNWMMSASRLPALMGLSNYGTPNDELDKSIMALKGQEWPELDDAEPAEWGNLLEAMVLEQACLRVGINNLDLEHPEPYFHPTLPLCCSLDGSSFGHGQRIEHNPGAGIIVDNGESIILDGRGVMEAKVTSVRPEASLSLARGPVQLQAQMMVTGYTWGAVCVLYGGNRMRVFFFRPHEATIAAISAAVTDFARRLDVWKETGAIDYYPPIDPPAKKGKK